MKPEIGTGERNRSGKDPDLLIEHFFAKVVNCDHSETTEEDADNDKGRVCIVNKEIDEPSEHDIEKIPGRVGLMNGDIVILQGKGKLHGIPVVQKLTREGNTRQYSQDEKRQG